MNRKKIVAIAFMLCGMGGTSFESFASEIPIDLEVRKIDGSSTHLPSGKSPVEIPSVWLDGHTLTFDACHDGYTLNIVSGDVVVYTVYVPANTTEVVLPAYLSGTFELQLIQGNLCFYGEIDL